MENPKEERSIPLLGDKFPTMSVQTSKGKMDLPSDFSGRWFILFSHPGDFTPVCTTEFVAFQKRFDKFKKLNTCCYLLPLSHFSYLPDFADLCHDNTLKFVIHRCF